MRNLLIWILGILSVSLPIEAIEKLTGTPIASYPMKAQLAFDGDDQTYYYDPQKLDYGWVGLDLGSPYIISGISWNPVNNKNISSFILGVFQGANNPDFSDAIPIYMIQDETKMTAEINCSRGFRYVRYVGPSHSHSQITSLEFYGEPGKGDDSHLWQITNLPLVCINTENDEIPYDKETYINSTFILISQDGQDILQQSKTGIRERGNASRQFPKKPWKIKFDKKQYVLDAPAKAKKWTLINNYGDKTLMRNMLAFDIAKKMGMEYVPYCTPVNVVLNGEYKGCYQLCDQIEVNENRVDIEEMESSDVEGEALTGGYLVEIDAHADEEPVWFTTDHYLLPVTVKSPDYDVIVDSQMDYIRDYFNILEEMMQDTDPNTGYRNMFDNESFIQHMLVNEATGNTDAYWSTFMYKKRSDPLIYTGPVWDFDLGFNNDYRTYPVTQKSGNGYLWNSGLASAAGKMRTFAHRIINKDTNTKPEILKVWRQAREEGLTAEWLEDRVNEYAEILNESQRLNFMRWPILNQKVHMNPKAYSSYEAECQVIKEYLSPQINHLDKLIGYQPEINGVESIITEEEREETKYFTVTGVQVDRPRQRGVYIEVKGKCSNKIFVP